MQEYIVVAVLYSPFWFPAIVPLTLLIYHAVTAKVWWQVSAKLLLILVTAECAALAISVIIERALNNLWQNAPVPG
jgi:hypothetical protein